MTYLLLLEILYYKITWQAQVLLIWMVWRPQKRPQVHSGKGSDLSIDGAGAQIQVMDHGSNPVGHDSQEIIRRNEDRCWGDRCSDSDGISYDSEHDANPNTLEDQALVVVDLMDNVEALAVGVPNNDCEVDKTSSFI